MGSLPDLTERSRPNCSRPAARTTSDPQRHRNVISQIPVSTICKKEWPWKKQKVLKIPPPVVPNRRRDSAASSVGAASIRRLITRQPPKVPKPIVKRFTFLCVASALCATSLLPFTALVGAETGAVPLAIMHSVAAIAAPFSPIMLQKTSTTIIVTTSYILLCVLLIAHTVDTPMTILLPLYGICGITLSPMTLALSVAATSLAQAAGDECRRKVALRRALRALRASQDIGLVVGTLLLGGALICWPPSLLSMLQLSNVHNNQTIPRWSSNDEYFMEDDYQEQTCGSAGCPDVPGVLDNVLSTEGHRILIAVWAAVTLIAGLLGVYGTSSTPAPPPDARSVVKDPRALLGAPMGLFIGLQQGFFYTSYIKWYGVCVGGWSGAWRALFSAGVLQSVAAATLSMAAARGRRGALALGGAVAHASLIFALLRWRAASTDLALPAVTAAAWGALTALWDVLHSGLCVGGPGWRGPWSIALAARHAGLALGCVARRLLCVRTQLGAVAFAMATAVVTHAALERRLRRGDQRHRS